MPKASALILWRGARNRGEALLAAITPDDPDNFEAELIGEGEDVEMRIVVDSDGLAQSRSTVDDILACLSAAESGLDSIN